MKKRIVLGLVATLTTLSLSAFATSYPGNGSSAWGGPVGQGTLTLTDDGTTLNLSLTKGPGNLNDALVIYIDSKSGGFTDTSLFSDDADGARSAISGFSGGNRSLMTFASGFEPDYAVAIESGYASLFGLASGGSGSLQWKTGTGQGGNTSPTFSLSFPLSDIAISAGGSFTLFGTYIAPSAWRGPEAIAGNDTGTDGFNPFTQTEFSSYTSVPEPSALALIGCGLAGLVCLRRRQ